MPRLGFPRRNPCFTTIRSAAPSVVPFFGISCFSSSVIKALSSKQCQRHLYRANNADGRRRFQCLSTPIIDPSTGQPFSNNRIPVTSFDAVAAKVLTYWPAPNYGPPGATSNNYFRLSPQDPKTPIYDYKVDWSISPAHQLSFTAHNMFGTTAYTGDIPGPACYNTEDCGSSGQYEYAYQASEKWLINPRMVNAFYATILRENYWNFSPTFNQNFPSKLVYRPG